MENSPSTKSIAYTYGLALALYNILMLVVVYVLNINLEGTINFVISALNIIITVVIFTIALKAYKKSNTGFIGLSEALKTGLAVAVIAGLLTGIYTYIHYSYIFPEFFDIMAEQQKMGMIENGQMSDAQVQQTMEMTSMTRTPFFMSTITLLMSVFFGFIITLIIGLIIKKKNPALD